MARLTEKQKKFVNEYLKDLNATQAAIRAGYSKKTADRIGNENLKKLEIQKYLEQRMKDREKRTEITQDQVVQELAKIALANGTDFVRIAIKTGYRDILNEAGEVIRKEPFEYQGVELLNTDEIPEEKRAAIAGIKQGANGIEVKLNDKVKALELLGRHLGMFKDKVELSGKVDSEIEIVIGTDDYET